MALVVANRVQETTTTTGTGTVTLAGAVAGYQSFAAIGDGNTTYYTLTSGNNWEVGIGTYTASGTTLARTTVLASSAGGTTKITLSGTSNVFVTYPSDKALYTDASGNAIALGTPASGTVTNLTGTASININGTVGATTASTGAFTTTTATTSVSSGVASTTQGSLVLHNTSANSTTLKSSNSASAAYTITLPVAAGTNGQVLTTDGTGVTSWATASGTPITSTSANAFAVGRQGNTDPVLNVDASTASVVTGLNLKGAAAAGGMAMSVTSSGANENLTIDAKGSGTITLNGTATGGVGIGMTPSSILDITQTQNAESKINLLNSSAGTGAISGLWLQNGTHTALMRMNGASYTTSTVFRQDGMLLYSDGAGGITIDTGAAQPIYFGINSVEVARFDTSGRLQLGTTAGTGRINMANAGGGIQQINSTGGAQEILNLYSDDNLYFSAPSNIIIRPGGGGEVARFGSDGSLLVGTTTNSGAGVVRATGGFKTTTGSTVLTTSVATTIFTMSATGSYLVYAEDVGGSTAYGCTASVLYTPGGSFSCLGTCPNNTQQHYQCQRGKCPSHKFACHSDIQMDLHTNSRAVRKNHDHHIHMACRIYVLLPAG
jgi:hypothetical protein